CPRGQQQESQQPTYGSGDYTKGDYARTFAATLAYFLWTQRDAVGVMTFDEGVVDYLPSRYRQGHLRRLMLALEREYAGTSTDLGAPIEQIARVVTKRSLIVLVSDLLAPLESLETQLGFLRSRGHEVVVFRVLDPKELKFDFEDAAVFEDRESGRDLYVDPDAIRKDYLRRFQEHADAVETICGNLGVELQVLRTDQALELALFDFVSARLRRGRTVRRQGMVPGAGKGGA
ncbi:MAG: DUF58 domain-containing protein, partial [Planctomycetota bacterium]